MPKSLRIWRLAGRPFRSDRTFSFLPVRRKRFQVPLCACGSLAAPSEARPAVRGPAAALGADGRTESVRSLRHWVRRHGLGHAGILRAPQDDLQACGFTHEMPQRPQYPGVPVSKGWGIILPTIPKPIRSRKGIQKHLFSIILVCTFSYPFPGLQKYVKTYGFGTTCEIYRKNK